jgi:hypothetical protein
MVHIAISKAPVSEPGTMPMRAFQELENFAHQIDAIGQTRLADLRAVRTAQRFGRELGKIKRAAWRKAPTRKRRAGF